MPSKPAQSISSLKVAAAWFCMNNIKLKMIRIFRLQSCHDGGNVGSFWPDVEGIRILGFQIHVV